MGKEEKFLFAFARLSKEKRSHFNKLLSCTDIRNMSDDEKVSDIAVRRKGSKACPRIGDFHFEDGTQISFDLWHISNIYEVNVYVAEGCKKNYALYDYEGREIQTMWDITPEDSDTTYVCVFLENNTQRERNRFLSKMKEDVPYESIL